MISGALVHFKYILFNLCVSLLLQFLFSYYWLRYHSIWPSIWTSLDIMALPHRKGCFERLWHSCSGGTFLWSGQCWTSSARTFFRKLLGNKHDMKQPWGTGKGPNIVYRSLELLASPPFFNVCVCVSFHIVNAFLEMSLYEPTLAGSVFKDSESGKTLVAQTNMTGLIL